MRISLKEEYLKNIFYRHSTIYSQSRNKFRANNNISIAPLILSMENTSFCKNNTSDFNDDLIDGDTGNKIVKIIFIFIYATLNHSLLGKDPIIDVGDLHTQTNLNKDKGSLKK